MSMVGYTIDEFKALRDERDKLKAQRDALLAAAKKALPTLEGCLRAKGVDWVGGYSAAEGIERLRAAIEKAEKP